jgi:hypothetical protein
MTRVSNLLGSLAVASSALAGGLMVSQAAPANAATFNSGTIAVDAQIGSTLGQSFTVTDDFIAPTDTITIDASGVSNLDGSPSGYKVNAAGIVLETSSNGDPVGGFYPIPTSGALKNGANYGALLLGNSTLGYVQVFPADVIDGLNSTNPPTTLSRTFAVNSLFAGGINTNEVLQFLVNDSSYQDNGGGFSASVTLTNSRVAAVPEPFTIIGTLVGGTAAFRLKRKLKLAAK